VNALINWYQARQPREQRMVLWGGVAVVIMIVGTLLLLLQQSVSAAAERVARKQQDMIWIQSILPRLSSAQAGGGIQRGNDSLVVLADRTAREAGVALVSSQPSGNGGLRVRAEKVAFDSVVTWLGQLTQRHGVHVVSAAIDAVDAEGVVNVSLELRDR
jgi:general secretion pathway protein M